MSELSVPVPRRSWGVGLMPLRMFGDDRLAELAAAGDRRAFVAIYERYHQALFRYCRSIVRSDEDARDALQNVMASALRSLDGESRQITLKPWLYRVAHNECVSILRRRSSDVGLDEASEVPGSSGADPATRERLRELVGDLRELQDQQRGALVMRELSGLEYTEIGAAFGITAAAATQAVYDARRGLHELAEGRAMDCEAIRRLISANDRRSLRARRVRGHLRACRGCRDFQSALSQRMKDFAALAPVLPAPAAAALLHSVSGGGAGTSGAGGMSAVAAGAGKAAYVSAVVKGVAVVAVAATVGTGAVAVRQLIVKSHPPPSPSQSPGRSTFATSHAGARPAVVGEHIRRVSGDGAPTRVRHADARGHREHAGGSARRHRSLQRAYGRPHAPSPSREHHPTSRPRRGNVPARQPGNSRATPAPPSQPARPPQSQPSATAPPASTHATPSASGPSASAHSSAPASGVGAAHPGR